jgi:mannosyltransferase
MADIQNKKTTSIILFLCIVFLGAGLRLYHLGFNGFWFDEIGVANVAYAENILEILRISKSHVMAMPLDYLIAYLTSRVGNSEFILRLPAAIWGILSIVALYFIARDMSEYKAVPFYSAFLLAISPIHVYYSQELRFYAVLVFFVLAGALSLKKAIQFPAMKNWLIYHAVILIGCFFHIYVLFVLVLGGIWLFIIWLQKKNGGQVIGKFVITNINILIIVFAAVYLLTSNQHTGTVYTNVFQVILKAVAAGLGVMPYNFSRDNMFAVIVSILFLIPFVYGLIHFLSGKAGLWNQGIALFIPVAVILLVGFDLVKAYFIQSRQFLFVLPFVLYVMAYGVFLIGVKISPDPQMENRYQRVLPVVFLSIFIIVSGISLHQYYQTPKSYVREIVQQLQYPDESENTIFITPPYDVGSFLYYYQKIYGDKYAGRLIGFEGSDIDQLQFLPGDFVMIDSSLGNIDINWLENYGMTPILITHPLQNRMDILWLLPDSPDS